jgi:hypothetical protein
VLCGYDCDSGDELNNSSEEELVSSSRKEWEKLANDGVLGVGACDDDVCSSE